MCKQEAVDKSVIFPVYLSCERAGKFQVVSVTTVNKSGERERREERMEPSIYRWKERTRKSEINVTTNIFMCAWSREQSRAAVSQFL
jgi:hypothetical protein